MYANVRQYRISADAIDETMHLADTELADRLAESPASWPMSSWRRRTGASAR
jgi:hypothetical protein